MGRRAANIDISQRFRQFMFLIIVAALGMIVSISLLGKKPHAPTEQKKTTTSAASFK